MALSLEAHTVPNPSNSTSSISLSRFSFLDSPSNCHIFCLSWLRWHTKKSRTQHTPPHPCSGGTSTLDCHGSCKIKSSYFTATDPIKLSALSVHVALKPDRQSCFSSAKSILTREIARTVHVNSSCFKAGDPVKLNALPMRVASAADVDQLSAAHRASLHKKLLGNAHVLHATPSANISVNICPNLYSRTEPVSVDHNKLSRTS
jgi:hypothetical protein